MRYTASRFFCFAVAAALTCLGCEGSKNAAGEGGAGAFLPAKPGGELPAFVVPKAVPAAAFAVLSVRAGRPLIDWYAKAYAMGKEAPEGRVEALRKDLDDYIGKHWGIHLTGAHSLTVFMTPDKNGAALIHGVTNAGGSLTGPELGEVSGVKIHVLQADTAGALVGDTLIVSDEAGVSAALRAHGGEASLAGSNSTLEKMLQDESTGASVILAAVMEGVPKELEAAIGYTGIEQAHFKLGPGGIVAVAQGEPKKMEALAYQAKGLLSTARALAESQRDEAVQRDEVVEGVIAILGFHSALQAEEAFAPKVEGRRLSLDFPLEMESNQPMVYVAIVGILAAVAIPAFTKYMKRSKTSEARIRIAQIFDGVTAHIEEVGACPVSPGLTPALSVNCNEGPGSRCVPGESYLASVWTDNPAWVALGFEMSSGHYYHYDVAVEPRPDGCEFRVQAFGDLDDDGVFSTYERSAAVEGTTVNAAAGLFVENEVE